MLRSFLVLLVFACGSIPAYALIAAPETMNPQYTEDPNHPGFHENGLLLGRTQWKNYKAKCEPCAALVDSYNKAMSQLLDLKYEREVLNREIKSQEEVVNHVAGLKNSIGDAMKGQGGLEDVDEKDAAKKLDKLMMLDDMKKDVRKLSNSIAVYHNTVVDLWQQILECQKQCKPANDNGPSWAFVPNEYNTKNLPFDWKGPYPAVCPGCAALAQRLNALPVMAIKEVAELEAQKAKKLAAEVNIKKANLFDIPSTKGFPYKSREEFVEALEKQIEQAKGEMKRHESNLAKMKKNFDQTLALYNGCVKKCPPQKTSAVIETPDAEPAQNVSVASDSVVDDLQISPPSEKETPVKEVGNTPKKPVKQGSYIKTTQDPNHAGWVKAGMNSSVSVKWSDVSTDCLPCQSLVKQYNIVMAEVMDLRRWRRVLEEIQDGEDAEALYDLRLSGSTVRDKKDIKPGELKKEARLDGLAKALGDLIENDNVRNETLSAHDKLIQKAENMAQQLRQAVADCEEQCSAGTKTTGIKVGGLPAIKGADTALPEWKGMPIDFPWKGPYPAKCPKCKPIADHINKLYTLAQEQIIERDSISRRHDAGLFMLGYDDEMFRLNNNLKTIKENFAESIKRYNYCIKKVCSDNHGKTACAAPWGKTSITVGPNDKYGTGAELKSKAKGMAMGALGGMLGGGGKSMGGVGSPMGGSSQKDPPTDKDPVRDGDKVEHEATNDDGDEVETAVGFAWDDEGNFLISAEIEDADQDGTFQTIFIDNMYGSRYRAFTYYLYELYYKWKLTVTWTHEKFRDGKRIYHDEGTKVTTGTEKVGSFEVFNFLDEETVINEAIWNILGFNSALKGPKGVGAKFKITRNDFQNSPRMTLVVHVTQPENKQVDTIPVVYGLLYSGPLSGAFDDSALKIYAMPKGDANAVDANGTLINDPCYTDQAYWRENQAGVGGVSNAQGTPALGISSLSSVEVVDVVKRSASEAVNDNVGDSMKQADAPEEVQLNQPEEGKKKKSLFNFNSGKKINRGAGND